MKKLLIGVFLIIQYSSFTVAQSKSSEYEIPFTLDDRDRLIQLHQKVKDLDRSLNQRMNDLDGSLNQGMGDLDKSLNARLDDVQTFQYWSFGTIITFMAIMLGFVIWDRRTVVKPVEKQQAKLIEVLKEYSKNHPDLKELFDKASIL